MVGCHLLSYIRTVYLEKDEVAYQVEEVTLLEYTVKQYLQFWNIFLVNSYPVAGAPGQEPLPARCQHSHTGLSTVTNYQHFVVWEKGGYIHLIGLKLVEGCLYRGIFVSGIF
ncbi:hypothetical protein ES708_28017 [subsurface metagenome]